MKPRVLLCLFAAVLALCPLLAPAATLEEIEAKVIEAFSKVKSMTADTSMAIPPDPQMPDANMNISGHIELLVDGDVSKFAQNLAMKMEMGGQTQEMKMEMLCDGEFMYTINEGMGQKTATKTKIGDDESFPPPGSKMLLAFLKKQFTLEPQEDKDIDGQSCYVLQGLPNDESPGMNKLLVYFSKESGLPLQMDMYQGENEKPAVMRYTNVKINPEISADKFVFKAPDGVEVMDLTKSTQQLELNMDVDDADEGEETAPEEEPADGSLKLKNSEP